MAPLRNSLSDLNRVAVWSLSAMRTLPGAVCAVATPLNCSVSIIRIIGHRLLELRPHHHRGLHCPCPTPPRAPRAQKSRRRPRPRGSRPASAPRCSPAPPLGRPRLAWGESDKKGKKDVGATPPIHVVEAADTEGGAPVDGTPAGGGGRWVHVPC